MSNKENGNSFGEILPENNFVRVEGVEYPKSVVEEAEEIRNETGGSLKEAIQAILTFEEAKRNATHADPNEPIRIFLTLKNTPFLSNDE